MQSAASSKGNMSLTNSPWLRFLLALPIIYVVLLLGQPAGLDIPKVIDTIRQDPLILVQQLVNGLSNGAIIAIIALGYTLVYGIIELVNFANSEVFMIGTFTALIAMAPFVIIGEDGGQSVSWWAALLAIIPAMLVGALLNVSIERIAYRRLRNAPRLIVLISAIGMAFILQNIGLQLGAFGKLVQAGDQFAFLRVLGTQNAAPKSFPRIEVFSDNTNLLDYVFPPPAEATAAPGATSGELSPEQAQATVDAMLEVQLAEQATADAAVAATEAAGGVIDPEATPEVPTEGDGALLPEDPLPTLDPADAAIETEIAATSVALGTPLVPAEGEAVVAEEPTPDLVATMQAEGVVIPDESPAAADGSTTIQTTRVRITLKDVLVVSVALALMLILRWFIENTKMGKAMRATAQNRSAAQIMGIDIDRVIAITFAIGGALAGAAGMMTGVYNGTFVFTMGFTAGLRSFTAAVLGGIGNITGAALGGLLIGILAAFSDQFLSVRWTNAWVFLVLVLVMLFRPTGLLGKSGGEKA
jgi:branched-subunit amino acid ABC-type transport system permease component